MGDTFDQQLRQSLGVYSVTFKAVAITAAQDLFSLLTPATCRAVLRAIYLNQYSDFGDAQAEILSVALVRGNTVAGSGGGAFTPIPLRPWMQASQTVVRINDTTIASSGTEQVMIADGWNVAAGWPYQPCEAERIGLDVSSRLALRILAPADSLTVNGTLIFEEFSA